MLALTELQELRVIKTFYTISFKFIITMNIVQEYIEIFNFFWLEHLLFRVYFYDAGIELKEIASYCNEHDWDMELRYVLLYFIHERDFFLNVNSLLKTLLKIYLYMRIS